MTYQAVYASDWVFHLWIRTLIGVFRVVRSHDLWMICDTPLIEIFHDLLKDQWKQSQKFPYDSQKQSQLWWINYLNSELEWTPITHNSHKRVNTKFSSIHTRHKTVWDHFNLSTNVYKHVLLVEQLQFVHHRHHECSQLQQLIPSTNWSML